MTRDRFAALCAVLFVLYVNGWLWWAVGVAAVCYLVWSSYKRLEEKRAADAETVRRADYEHALTLRGDERGVYGQGWPVIREYQCLVSLR